MDLVQATLERILLTLNFSLLSFNPFNSRESILYSKLLNCDRNLWYHHLHYQYYDTPFVLDNTQ